jgi:hypothetical protein
MVSPMQIDAVQYYKIRPRNVKVKGLILTRRHTTAETKTNGISRKATKMQRKSLNPGFTKPKYMAVLCELSAFARKYLYSL